MPEEHDIRTPRNLNQLKALMNRYLAPLSAPPSSRVRRRRERDLVRLQELRTLRDAGWVSPRVVVRRSGGKVTGRAEVLKPLKPADLARALAELRLLEEQELHPPLPELSQTLRPAFLAALPELAERLGLDASGFLAVGVPLADLQEAGLVPTTRSPEADRAWTTSSKGAQP